MNEQELLKAQRLMLIGALSEEPELKAQVDTAHAQLKEVINQHGDAGKLAVAILALDIGIEGN